METAVTQTETASRHPLIERVIELQALAAASDRDFAEHLGLSNGQYSGVKKGRLKFGTKSLRLIEQKYPELTALVEDYWLAILRADRNHAA